MESFPSPNQAYLDWATANFSVFPNTKVEYCSHQIDIIQVIHRPQGLSLQIPISPSHTSYPDPCVTQTPFNSNITLEPGESTSREEVAERNKQQAATLRIASKRLRGIAEKGMDMFSEVKF
ncbi:hypothetical protein llap_11178 [Limosa lapponica baueri]|uniref:Uncharacterized protein n=1 Tax=Limosa lapponica baueri TaxID=1758121 RepID=A0A2I0TXH1_LIMLA|nr:hypothetical protein llap_11178 [Limosa lapponica baueri]